MEMQLARREDLRFKPRPYKLLAGHAVISDEADSSERCCAKDAHLAQVSDAEMTTQREIDSDGHGDRKQRKNELPHAEAEEYGFRIVADLPVDFNFQGLFISCFCILKNRRPEADGSDDTGEITYVKYNILI